MSAKQLLIIRHAKSSWSDSSQKDFDRPLNERGKKDAPEMAKRVHKQNNIQLDAIMSSPALRALTTATYFAQEFGISKRSIIEIAELYDASLPVFYNVVANISNSFISVALFSHNPGVTVFSNMLTKVKIDDMPTCAVIGVRINTAYWKDFFTAKKEFLFFDYPKNIS